MASKTEKKTEKKIDQPAAKKAGAAEPSLSRQIGLLVLATAVLALLSAAGLYLLVFKPMLNSATDSETASILETATLSAENRLIFLNGLASKLASTGIEDLTVDASLSGGRQLADRRLSESLSQRVANTMPLALRVVVFPKGQARRDDNSIVSISFAGVELARKIENGSGARTEAFVADGKWLLQLAAPVLLPQEAIDDQQTPWGSLLIILPAALLTDVLPQVPGKLELLQEVAAAQQIVHTTGNDDQTMNTDLQLTRQISGQPWILRYTPPARSSDGVVFSSPVFWLCVLAPAVLLMLLIWIALRKLAGRLNEDLTNAASYTQARLRGERRPRPVLRTQFFSAFFSLLQVRSDLEAPDATKNPAGDAGPAAGRRSGEDRRAKPRIAPRAASNTEALFDDEESDAGESVAAGATAASTAEVESFDLLGSDDDLLGLNDLDEDAVKEISAVQISKVIFRAYDIRGIVGETLTDDIMTEIGRALGSEGRSRGVASMCIGYDGRNSSKSLAEAVISGLLEVGMNVIEIGQVPTPLLYFAAQRLQTGSGAMITGSHNPASHNGLKMMLSGDTLAGEDIQKLYQRTIAQNFTEGSGTRQTADVRQDYLDEILNDIAVAAPLKVVVDAGNGVSGAIAPGLIEDLGCEVIQLYCEVDGNFPNHHPDPSNPENLEDLRAKVIETGADIGIAFDGDGDRLGVVTNSGKIIWPDRLLMLFARDVVSRNPGADVIFDVKCSRRLNALVSRFGGRPVMWKTGHSMIKAKMRETGALLAGEMSGHIFFRERWFGFDDGLYAAVRLLEILGIDERSADLIFEDFPEDISTPELIVECQDEAKFDFMEELEFKADWSGGTVNSIDGLRIEYADGWGLVRASNTMPALTMRFEAETNEAMQRITSIFRSQILKCDPNLNLPF